MTLHARNDGLLRSPVIKPVHPVVAGSFEEDVMPVEESQESGTAEEPAPRSRWPRIWRAVRWGGVAVLCLLLVAATVGAVAALFVRDELLDTDEFVSRAAPLADDPVVQKAVGDRISDELDTTLDMRVLSGEAKKWLSEKDPPGDVGTVMNSAVSGLRETLDAEVHQFVAGPKFARAWETAVRKTHSETVKVLDRQQGDVLRHKDTALTVELGPVIAAIKTTLLASGLDIAEKIPQMSLRVPLADSQLVPRLQDYTQLLRSAAVWLPWAAVGGVALSVLLAPGRRRAVLTIGVVLGCVGLGVAATAAFARDRYLGQLGDPVASAAGRALSAGFVSQYVIVAVTGLAVAAACGLLGRFGARRAAESRS